MDHEGIGLLEIVDVTMAGQGVNLDVSTALGITLTYRGKTRGRIV
jgi:hypothetical protein